MFTRSAHVYDNLYEAAGKDYAHETAIVAKQIRQRLPDARTLLDVACGTGRHIEHLSREFACTGVDLDPRLLRTAQERCGSAQFAHGDMRDFDLGTTFDVVTCLFASIGYMLTTEDLCRAVRQMARHVRPGGLLVIEPCYSPEVWRTDYVGTIVAESSHGTAVRMGRSELRGHVAVVDLHYLVGSACDVRYFSERHELGLFAIDEYREAFTAAGLAPDLDPVGPAGRGLLLATVPPTTPASEVQPT